MRTGCPPPRHRLLERFPPALSDDFLPALRAGRIVARPVLAALDGGRARFVDGSTESVDEIVCATGYRISFPFLSETLIVPEGRRLALYRRVLSPAHPSLAFIGLVDPLGGRLPVVEAQAAWLADVFDETIRLPDRAAMLARSSGASIARGDASTTAPPTASSATVTPTCEASAGTGAALGLHGAGSSAGARAACSARLFQDG